MPYAARIAPSSPEHARAAIAASGLDVYRAWPDGSIAVMAIDAPDERTARAQVTEALGEDVRFLAGPGRYEAGGRRRFSPALPLG